MLAAMGDAASVERTYYAVSGLYTLAASLIWGVNTLFLLDAGLDIFEVFVANAAFTAGMVLFEVPTGVLADTRGRRFSFLLSLAVLAAGTGGYVAAARAGSGLGTFVVISVVLGLGFTFYSGAVEAWLVDALAAVGFTGSLDRIFSRAGMVTGAAMLLGTVGGGALGEIDLAVPFVVRTALLLAVLVYSWRRLHDLGFEPRQIGWREVPAEMRVVAANSIAYGWSRPEMRLLVGMSFVELGVVNWAWYAWQPYLVELADSQAVWFVGVVAALLSLSIMAGNALVGRLSARCGKRTTLLGWGAGTAVVGSVLVGLATSAVFAVAAFLLIGLALGLIGPVKQAFVHQVVPSEYRASVLSFDSMIGNAGGVGGQLGLGAISRSVSIGAGYLVGGAALGLMLPLVWRLRRRGGIEDVIVGGEAGVGSACAAQGLPEITGVDSKILAPAADV
jgi:MFS family permease